MTIITKPLSEKKGDKLVVPLVDNDQLATAPPVDDPESQNPDLILLRARARRVSTATTLCLLFTSLIVVGVGIVGGKFLYDQYISTQIRRFKGYAEIPYNDEYDNADADYMKLLSSLHDVEQNELFSQLMPKNFRERFEIDVTGGSYEKIDVPDFRDGRRGRFVHDFNTNVTGIVDITGDRCFVMPLNRGNVLPPKSLFDLVEKMWKGYYKVDTQIVRKTMRVVTPPITDMKSVGNWIGKECEGRPVYRLEKFVGGVVKRSVHQEVKFAQFSGKGIIEFDIVNFDELQEFEKEHNIH